MSAFLGPIHIKMYERVLYQDAMAGALLSFAEEQGWADGLRERADARAPAASTAPLETLIDQSNIHGWLSHAVAISEGRYALIVSGILAGHPERLETLRGVMKDLGRKSGLPSLMDAEQAFQAIHNILLDGMPCDFPFQMTESGADAVQWLVTNCPHAPYWDAENGDAEAYYCLRDAWIEGALEGSSITHSRSKDKHTLRQEE